MAPIKEASIEKIEGIIKPIQEVEPHWSEANGVGSFQTGFSWRKAEQKLALIQ